MVNKHAQELGKLGAKKKWADRYEIIKKLSGHYNKEISDKFLSWPTAILKELLKHAENKK